MSKLIIGFILGLVVATVGFGGIARILDNGVSAVKHKAKNWPSETGKSNQNYCKSG
jgi:hypothetical protein